MHRSSERSRDFACGGLIALVLVVVLGWFVFAIAPKEGSVSLAATGKDRSATQESSYHLEWSKEGKTFKNSGPLPRGKFSSSDRRGQSDEEEVYVCTVSGVRITVLTTDPDPLSCEPAGK